MKSQKEETSNLLSKISHLSEPKELFNLHVEANSPVESASQNIQINNTDSLFKNELIQNSGKFDTKVKITTKHNSRFKFECTINEEKSSKSEDSSNNDSDSDYWLKYLQDLEEEQELLKLETDILLRNRNALQDITSIKSVL